jgi:hypothetical protein
MQNLRNKKRLVSLAVVFALVFLAGAAFALADGTLEISGNVSVAGQGYVRWYADDADGTRLEFAVADSGNDALVGHEFWLGTNWSTGLSRQVLMWNIEFGEPGSVALTAVAINDSGIDAEITAMRVSWMDNSGNTINSNDFTDFGLTVDFLGSDAVFLTSVMDADGGLSEELLVEVFWDGTVPPNFVGSFNGGLTTELEDVLLGGAGTLMIEFDYAPL